VFLYFEKIVPKWKECESSAQVFTFTPTDEETEREQHTTTRGVKGKNNNYMHLLTCTARMRPRALTGTEQVAATIARQARQNHITQIDKQTETN
jgi:hypothetical protein